MTCYRIRPFHSYVADNNSRQAVFSCSSSCTVDKISLAQLMKSPTPNIATFGSTSSRYRSAYRPQSRIQGSPVYRTKACSGAAHPVRRLQAHQLRASQWKLQQITYRCKSRNLQPHLAAGWTHDYAATLSVAPSNTPRREAASEGK